jgi:hypothetical protein
MKVALVGTLELTLTSLPHPRVEKQVPRLLELTLDCNRSTAFSQIPSEPRVVVMVTLSLVLLIFQLNCTGSVVGLVYPKRETIHLDI